MSKWRETYKVHPAADVFPMMSDDELATLGADIKATGLKQPIMFWNREPLRKGIKLDVYLLDGRNRLEAMERAGISVDGSDPDGGVCRTLFASDPVAFVISQNIHRRHLTKQERADLIVAAIKAGEKLVSDRPVSKGGRGKVNPTRQAAVGEGKKHGIGETTMKAAVAKAEGRKPLSDHRQDQLDRRNFAKSHPVENALSLIRKMTPAQRNKFDVEYSIWCQRIGLKRTKPSQLAKIIMLIASPHIGERDSAFATANRLLEPMGLELVEKQASRMPQGGRSEGAVGDPACGKNGGAR